jgi:hypothetical protein
MFVTLVIIHILRDAASSVWQIFAIERTLS